MNGKSIKSREEWFKQAQYDIGTAEVMLKTAGTFTLFSSVILPWKRR